MGAEVSLAIATDGAAGGHQAPEALRRIRRAEARTAAAPLGTEPRFLDFPDGGLMPDAALIAVLRGLLAEIRPDLGRHPRAERLSCRPPGPVGGDLARGQFRRPAALGRYPARNGFVPTHWVDVTAHFDAKCTAIRAHASQEPERFVAAATAQAVFRAGECNGGPNDRAEAFRFEPRFPFADIRALLPAAPAIRPVVPRLGASAIDRHR